MIRSIKEDIFPKAKKWCRVCFQTPFQRFFGFPEDSENSEMQSVCSHDDRGSEEAEKVKRWTALMHPRGHEICRGSAENIITSLVHNTPIDTDIFADWHKPNHFNPGSDCVLWNGPLNSTSVPVTEIYVNNTPVAVPVVKVLASLYADDLLWERVQKHPELLNNTCRNLQCVNLTHIELWGQPN